MKVVMLGAGSTIGTMGDATLGVADFTKRLDRVYPGWRTEYGDIVRAVDDCDGVGNLDVIWPHVDYAVKLKRSIQGRPSYDSISGQLRKAITRAYSLTPEFERLCDAAKRDDCELS